MYKYKIVASDLDGTLLNNNSQLSEENKKAIAELDKKGIFFVPSTGRTFREVLPELKNNDHIRFIMHTNGSVIHDKKTGEHIYNCIDNALALEIFDLLSEYDSHIGIRANGNFYVPSDKLDTSLAKHYGFTDAHVNCLENYAIPVENFREWLSTALHVEDFSVFFGNEAEFAACCARIDADKRLKSAKFPPKGLEIFSVNAGKGRALHLLADKLGIDRGETIAVGDSLNDFTMIEAAGLGLGVSNAMDELKVICDEIICSNEEHAIKYINECFFN
ncbi:MAG: Cof-type HAD-IIB family hydrolase [Clostridia bacterium]|nr:Cof-type HAD-IIB family hydrolase [Clostridia bacterium]